MPTAHLAASAGQAGTRRKTDRLQVSYAATCPGSPESVDTLFFEVRGAFWLRCPQYPHFLEKFQRAYAGLSEMVCPCSYSSSENQVEKAQLESRCSLSVRTRNGVENQTTAGDVSFPLSGP